MRQIKKMILFAVLMPMQAFAWYSNGHRLVAEIAYQNLTPYTRDAIAQVLNTAEKDKHEAILSASTWPDRIKQHGVTMFNHWHYIDLPYPQSPQPHHPKENIIWAINKSVAVLQNPEATAAEMDLFLRFLIHLVGDSHQPLHCVSHFSKTHPQGDKGGLLFKINHPITDSLHIFWDLGLGLFGQDSNDGLMKHAQLQQLASDLQKEYPKQEFLGAIENQNPYYWCDEAYRYIEQDVYKIKERSKPSKAYINRGQDIVKQRISLAGYRLAYLLNNIFNTKTRENGV